METCSLAGLGWTFREMPSQDLGQQRSCLTRISTTRGFLTELWQSCSHPDLVLVIGVQITDLQQSFPPTLLGVYKASQKCLSLAPCTLSSKQQFQHIPRHAISKYMLHLEQYEAIRDVKFKINWLIQNNTIEKNQFEEQRGLLGTGNKFPKLF